MNKSVYIITAFWMICAAFSLYSFRSLEQSNTWYVHTYEVIERNQKVFSFFNEAESCQRGYLLTGDGNLRFQYGVSTAGALATIAEAKTMISDNAPQQERLASVAKLANERIDQMDETIAIFEKKGYDPAKENLVRNLSTRHTDAIKRILRTVDDEERRLLEARKKTNEENFDNLHNVTYAALVISFLTFLVPFFRRFK